MKPNILASGALVAVAIPALLASGFGPVIGVVTALGTFTVNNSRTEGNANVFNGARIDTDRATTQVFLQDGPSVMLGTHSSATLFHEHMVLNKGATKVDRLGSYQVDSLGYTVRADDVAAKALVRLQDGNLQVASLAGSLQVLNTKGALLTRVGSGASASFNVAGQSGMIADQSGAMNEHQTSLTKQVLGYSAMGLSLAGLGISVDAELQRHPTSP